MQELKLTIQAEPSSSLAATEACGSRYGQRVAGVTEMLESSAARDPHQKSKPWRATPPPVEVRMSSARYMHRSTTEGSLAAVERVGVEKSAEEKPWQTSMAARDLLKPAAEAHGGNLSVAPAQLLTCAVPLTTATAASAIPGALGDGAGEEEGGGPASAIKRESERGRGVAERSREEKRRCA